jgi:hypothetical protein
MLSLFDQRLSAADALATAFCECSMQPARDVVLSGSVAWTLELALGRLGDNASQVLFLIVPVLGFRVVAFNACALGPVPVCFFALTHVCIFSVFFTLLQVLGVSVCRVVVEERPF